MTHSDILTLIETALRTPEAFVPRHCVNEPAVAWQARAVAAALKQKGLTPATKPWDIPEPGYAASGKDMKVKYEAQKSISKSLLAKVQRLEASLYVLENGKVRRKK